MARRFFFFLVIAFLVTRCAPPLTVSPVTLTKQTPTPTVRARKVKVRPTIPVITPSGPPALSHGPVVGAVTSNSARVFVRTNQPASVTLQYATTADLSDAVISAAQATVASHDFSTQIELDHLQSDTTYYLNVLVNNVPQFRTPYPQFKSFPTAGAPMPFKFVIVNDFFWFPATTFDKASAEQPDFVVIGGDFSHNNPTTLAEKRDLFKMRYTASDKSADFVKAILDRFTVAHFWDDHDFGANNSDKTYPQKELSLQVLQEFFPTYPLSQYGDWQKFSYGAADFFLLDARMERDPDDTPDSPTKSMLDGNHLGANGQYDWLTQGLLHSTATWKFIFSPVPFNPTVPKDDSWEGYPDERTKLVNFIRDNKISGIILLSGDLHAGGLDDGTHSDFPEMVVPSPNGQHCLTAPGPGKWSEGAYARPSDEPCNGYGVVTVQTNPNRVLLQVKNESGDVMLEKSFTQ